MKFLIFALSSALAGSAYCQAIDFILAEDERQREAVLRPLEEKFDAELDKLLQRLTAAGKFKESVEVDNLIKERRGGGLIHVAVGTWVWEDNRKLVLSSDGKATFSTWSGPGTWRKMDTETAEVINPDGVQGILKIQPDGKGIYTTGMNNRGSFSLTKQK
jgi:dipeptidyl aminopeptidase/acylaminoacyl peptidase